MGEEGRELKRQNNQTHGDVRALKIYVWNVAAVLTGPNRAGVGNTSML